MSLRDEQASLLDGRAPPLHVWIPAGAPITAVQPFAQQGADAGFAFTGANTPIANLTLGAWNTITVTVPANAQIPLRQIGVEFTTNALPEPHDEIRDAVRCHFDEGQAPKVVRPHFVREELLAV